MFDEKQKMRRCRGKSEERTRIEIKKSTRKKNVNSMG